MKIAWKRVGGKKMMDFFAIVLVCVVLGSFGQIYIKKGLNELGGLSFGEMLSTKLFSTFLNPNVFFGLALYAISTVLWFVALSMSDVSFLYPLISIGYIITALLAKFYFNETISATRWVAILVIVGGVFLLVKS